MALSVSSLILFASCSASGTSPLTWKHDGSVFDINKNTVKLDMQNVYAGYEFNNELYVIGYKIDKEGINYPAAARISSNLKNAKSWLFESDLQDIFVVNNKIHISDAEGAVFLLDDLIWKLSKIKLKPDSKVIVSNKDVIACYPSSPFKISNKIGACYSVNQDWSITVNWRKVTPRACLKYLYVYEKNNAKGVAKKIRLTDGEILASKFLNSIPKDLCKVNF